MTAEVQSQTGDFNRVTIEVSVNVICAEGFNGSDCNTFCESTEGILSCREKIEINTCDSSPCANNGSCIPLGPFNSTCECAPGFTGPECQVDIDECLTAICPENSDCVDAIDSYFCVCHSGFGGEQCTPGD